jgi:hypothetical protein
MAAVGTLDQIDRGESESNPQRWNIRIPGAIMLALFLAGVGFLIAAGWTLAN